MVTCSFLYFYFKKSFLITSYIIHQIAFFFFNFQRLSMLHASIPSCFAAPASVSSSSNENTFQVPRFFSSFFLSTSFFLLSHNYTPLFFILLVHQIIINVTIKILHSQNRFPDHTQRHHALRPNFPLALCVSLSHLDYWQISLNRLVILFFFPPFFSGYSGSVDLFN